MHQDLLALIGQKVPEFSKGQKLIANYIVSLQAGGCRGRQRVHGGPLCLGDRI